MMCETNRSGYITLLVTSILLLLTLIVSLAASKGVFFQIKIAQNELKARQAHWKAEGGLECAYSQIKSEILTLPLSGAVSLTGCTPAVSIEKVSNSDFIVKSKQADTQLKKVMFAPNTGLGAVLKTSASVELTGSMHFVPQADGPVSESECTSIVSGGSVNYVSSTSGTDEHFLSVDSTLISHSTVPSTPTFTCKDSHRSNLFDSAKTPKYLEDVTPTPVSIKGKDIQENVTDISAFYDLFNQEFNASNVAKLRNEIQTDPVGIVLDTDKTAKGWIKSCHTKLDNAYKAGKRRFWIDGSCAITGNIFGDSTQSEENAVQLIVYDGLLYIKAMSYFDGLLYQYVAKTFGAKEAWLDLFDSQSTIGVNPTSFHKHDVESNSAYNKYPFLLDGSLHLDGGLGLDVQDRTIKLNGSLIPAYNGGKIGKHITKIEWQRGSWNDL
ncbi:hypothetical protein ATG66_3281 [Vibrio sp. ES.051]|uniref:hypothetical protein n=1 Tax=Vibrio sp. ES.051 TaxID=1761909 RepID=UPI000C019DFA|nr:hypothetical protein [Vibrio sp. ES.051]PFG46165.1 hypothetical protein ATG66_3281 [Vibrio sp. ES.051]